MWRSTAYPVAPTSFSPSSNNTTDRGGSKEHELGFFLLTVSRDDRTPLAMTLCHSPDCDVPFGDRLSPLTEADRINSGFFWRGQALPERFHYGLKTGHLREGVFDQINGFFDVF